MGWKSKKCDNFIKIQYNLAGDKDFRNIKNSSEKQDNFFRTASRQAIKSNMSHKHGAVIVLNDEIISVGYNKFVTHLYNWYSVHAEIDAINKLPKKKFKPSFSKIDMYVVRIGPNSFNNPLKFSKPCFECEKAISRLGISKVYYSTNHEYIEKLKEKYFIVQNN